jgi:adenylate kinase family enzyme
MILSENRCPLFGIMPVQRVLVTGSSGAGKSTFARRLGEITGLPVIHIDQLYWNPGWVPVPQELYLERMRDAVAQERWIMDGNSPATFDLRVPRADRIILFERSRLACLARVGRRIATSYGAVRVDMAPGCPEKIDVEFLKYVWNYPVKHWPLTLAAIDRHAAWDRTTTLRSDAEAAAFLDALVTPRAAKLNAT